MGRLEGKVALVTGAARGQGRSHAVMLAQEGATVIALDICQDIATVPYGLGTDADLAETVKLVEACDQRALGRAVDVRDLAGLRALVDDAVAEFGGIDIACINHGILSVGMALDLEEDVFDDILAVNLGGVWRTIKAVAPRMIEQGRGGSIVITSSVAGIVGLGMMAHYSAAKHGVVGLMRALVQELSPHSIRVNCVHPGSVSTKMIMNEAIYTAFGMDSAEGMAQAQGSLSTLPIDFLDPEDISRTVVYLASDESRYVTGQTLAVDAGFTTKVG
jgi:SDR family mycofactocin-dependent oxidoreductase